MTQFIKHKYIVFQLLILSVILISSCEKNLPHTQKEVVTGFNVKWRHLPDVSNRNLVNNIRQLNPQILRYPGGTVTHKWDWKTGKAEPFKKATDFARPIQDLSTLVQQTGTKIVFVLDIVNKLVEDQIEMLIAADVPIEYIELGNELYAAEHSNYTLLFPDGKSYADTVNTWTPKLKSQFPNVKVSAVLMGRTPNPRNERQYSWNQLVSSNIKADIDAYTYHIYINDNGQTVEERIESFEMTVLDDPAKEIWITEYGAKNQNLSDLLKLADYVESIADIALNHVLISSNGRFSKLSSDGQELTKEGLAFKNRN